jgi:hypothetical protein
MAYWGILMHFRFRGSAISLIVKRTYDRVWLYPVIMAICWLLNFFCVGVPLRVNTLTVGLSMAFGISNGIFSTLLFIRFNPEVRYRWRRFFFLCISNGNNRKNNNTTENRDTNFSVQSDTFSDSFVLGNSSIQFSDISDFLEEEIYSVNVTLANHPSKDVKTANIPIIQNTNTTNISAGDFELGRSFETISRS